MSYCFDLTEDFEQGMHRIAREQISSALREIETSDLDLDVAVHQVRKRCKKLRGLLRLVRPALADRYREENASFRDAARLLSPYRDDTSMLECFGALMEHYEDQVDTEVFEPVREAFARRRQIRSVKDRLEDFAREMKKALERSQRWKLTECGFAAVRGGLEKTYRRARNGMADTYGYATFEDFHEWRKRVKYHWYHTRLLNAAWPKLLKVRAGALDELSDLLGRDHDLAVLRKTLQQEDFDKMPALVQLIEMRRRELEALAHLIGRRLFCEKPRQFGACMESYWQCRVEERALCPLPRNPAAGAGRRDRKIGKEE